MQKLSVLFLSLVVLFLFFAGFYLYYVPSNRSSLNKYGFLVLEQLDASMQYRLQGNESLYSNYARRVFSAPSAAGLRHARFWLRGLGVDRVSDILHPRDSARDGSKMVAGLQDIRDDRLFYSFRQGPDSLAFTIPVAQFMSSLLGGHASDFFRSFLFLKMTDKRLITIYKSAGLPLGKEIPVDSLLPNSKDAFYPGIADLHTGDLDFKLFYIPVSLGSQRYVLVGIKDTAEYTQATHAVPPGFIYPIVITLLLLLILSPLIRLTIMGPAEKLRLRDFTGYCFSLVAGSMLLTLIIIQVLLLSDGDERQNQRLHLISGQIDSAFQAELGRAYRQLAALDPLASTVSGRNNYDISREMVAYMRQHPDSNYYNFDRIDWVTDSGQQVINGSLQRNLDTIYINVARRKYFTDFISNSLVSLPGDTAQLSIQPVVTWTEGALRVIIAKRSVVPGIFITTLSTDLYSVNRALLPSGFGFCLIDADGRVQVHSDPKHSLNENFIDEVQDDAALRSAMKARQQLYLPTTKFYGREYGLMVKPIQNLPYYLVTYYDKGYIQPVNMRILIFSLAGCGTVLAIFIAMWFIFFRRRWNDRPLLFGVMDYLPWIVPRVSAGRIYRRGWIILLAYVVVTTILVTTAFFYGPNNNQRVLVLLWLTPLLVTIGLRVIIRMRRDKPARGVRLVHPFAHLIHYGLLVETLVLAMGVLPAALFTWYANNQELLQSVKKEQFLLAGALEARKPALIRNISVMDSAVAPAGLLEEWQYRRGIYSLNRDQLGVRKDSMPPPELAFGVASTYFEVAGWLANDYYDPEYVPVLQGASDDGRWQWLKPEQDIMRFYYALDGGKVLEMASALPQRYYYISNLGRGLLLLAFVGVLLWGLYKLIRRVSAGLFLQKFVVGERVAELPCFEQYCIKEGLAVDARAARMEAMQADIVKNLQPRGDEATLDAMEIETLHCIRRWADYFAVVLDGCDPKEKYLLFQFACNGFLNYKNVVEIDHLLQRGVLVVDNEEVKLFSRGFRAYILTHVDEDKLERSFIRRSAWQRFKVPFLILLMIAAAFLFFTRQEAWQRVSALVAALSSSLGLLGGLFKDMAPSAPAGGEE